MNNRIIFLFATILVSYTLQAQDSYKFTEVVNLESSSVKSQGYTGTCWSYSTSSFLESEIIRLTGKHIDISEMYNVRNTYPLKAENFVMRQGKAQFDEGALAHDVFKSIKKYGLVPNEVFTGLAPKDTFHNHIEMIAVLKSMLNTYVKNPGHRLSKNWKNAIEAVLDVYLGKKVEKFTYEGKEYTPQSFLKMTKINPNDYVNITSFNHADFFSSFILNVPDNFSNGSFFNIPLDKFIATIDHALENGFSIALDCDVSEKTFSSKDGVAVIPVNPDNNNKALTGIYPEKKITQEFRQEEFENYNTTDDHLMHITGILKDQNGTKYYKVKNSWGTRKGRTTNGGYVYLSESYLRLKTINIAVHKDGIPKDLQKKFNL